MWWSDQFNEKKKKTLFIYMFIPVYSFCYMLYLIYKQTELIKFESFMSLKMPLKEFWENEDKLNRDVNPQYD